MKLLVIGAGMYVTGRGETGPGTILASLCESSRALGIEEVTIAATKEDNRGHVRQAAARLNKRLGTSLSVRYENISGEPAQSIAQLCEHRHFDAVIISVPDHLHYGYAHACLEAGLHTMLVKPFVETLSEAKQLTELARDKQRLAVVEFHKRFDEANNYARGVIAAGEIGAPLYAVVRYSQRLEIPTKVFAGWAAKTNIFQYLAVHYVDLLWFLTGMRPCRVSAIGTRTLLTSMGIETYDSVHATIEWRGDDGHRFISQIASNWIDPDSSTAMSDQRYEIIGTRGRIDLDQKNRGLDVVVAGRNAQAVNPYFSSFLPGAADHDVFQGYGHSSVNSFVTDVSKLEAGDMTLQTLPRGRPTFADAQVSTAVIEAANVSLVEDGAWCEIPQ